MTDTTLILEQCDVIEQALARIRAECRGSSPQVGGIDRAAVLDAVAASAVPDLQWADRGQAPLGYCKGMGLAYALTFRDWLNGDEIAVQMAVANTGDDSEDALSWYNSNFQAVGMDNSRSGRSTLRHLFVLMYGLGMRESSGKFCEGRDQSADNTSAESAEAGLFQTSYDVRYGCPDVEQLLDIYRSWPDDPQRLGRVFHEDVSCSAQDMQNYGSGDGERFQYYQKASPMLAVQACGVALREAGGEDGHWGPIRRKEVELKREVDELFEEIEQIVERGAVSV